MARPTRIPDSLIDAAEDARDDAEDALAALLGRLASLQADCEALVSSSDRPEAAAAADEAASMLSLAEDALRDGRERLRRIDRAGLVAELEAAS